MSKKIILIKNAMGALVPAKSTRKWRATIVVNKKQIALGYFHREIEAAYAYDTAAIKYFGEFSRINNYE